MNESFSHDIIIEIIKNLSNSIEANKIINIFYKAYETKNADGVELGEIPQFNRLVEDAVSMLLKEYEGREGKDAQKREKILVNCYSKIVGKEGTTNKVIEQLSINDIDSLIRKLGSEEGLNIDSVVNIISKKASLIVDEEEREQLIKLTEDSIITSVNTNPERVENANVFKIFEMLVDYYKGADKSVEDKQENIGKINSVIETANTVKDELRRKYGEDSEEYKNACEELVFLTARANKFKTMNFKEFNEFIRVELLNKIQEAEIHESEGNISGKIHKEKNNEGSNIAKIMDPIEKFEKLCEAVELVQKDNPEKNIGIGTVMCETENISFDQFYIIQIQGAHCYVLEKFDPNENTALYVVDSSEINDVFQLIREKRAILKNHPRVTTVNHQDGLDSGYVTRIKTAIEGGTMQKENLNGLWEKAYALEAQISDLKGKIGEPGTKEGVENRQAEYALLQRLEKQYETILKQVEKQDKAVEKLESMRNEKAKKYIEKGGKQLDEKYNPYR